MKIERAIAILKEHNKWRRGTPPYNEVGNRQPYSPKDIGLAIDCVVDYFADGGKIDIDTACDWIESHLHLFIMSGSRQIHYPALLQEFRKAMLTDISSQLVNANKELTWHKVTDGNLPKDRVFLAHCVGMGKGYVDRVCWNKRNGGFDNLNDIPPYASIKESHLDEYYDWWMEIPELPKED